MIEGTNAGASSWAAIALASFSAALCRSSSLRLHTYFTFVVGRWGQDGGQSPPNKRKPARNRLGGGLGHRPLTAKTGVDTVGSLREAHSWRALLYQKQ